MVLGSCFDAREITKESKSSHFRRLKERWSCDYEDMLFFDNEYGNCREISQLGVTVAFSPDGVTGDVWAEAVAAFPCYKNPPYERRRGRRRRAHSRHPAAAVASAQMCVSYFGPAPGAIARSCSSCARPHPRALFLLPLLGQDCPPPSPHPGCRWRRRRRRRRGPSTILGDELLSAAADRLWVAAAPRLAGKVVFFLGGRLWRRGRAWPSCAASLLGGPPRRLARRSSGSAAIRGRAPPLRGRVRRAAARCW